MRHGVFRRPCGISPGISSCRDSGYHGRRPGAPMHTGGSLRGRNRRGDAVKVAVIGLGYVGTVTAACLAAHGHDVWGTDVDAAKAGEIRAGRSPVAEPGLGELVAQTV